MHETTLDYPVMVDMALVELVDTRCFEIEINKCCTNYSLFVS